MVYDLAIIGGGINGAGIARDAAGRGLKVLLLDKGDLGGATSSASSKLIHGGLRYLEQFQFRLVRESLAEREILLSTAPHLVRPMTFVLPHARGLRPVWMLRFGLWLYDHMGRRKTLPASRHLDLSEDPLGRALKQGFRHGFAYADCRVDDARLVVLTARDAADRGAEVRPRTACMAARRERDQWTLTLGNDEQVTARAVINAAGPWVETVDRTVLGLEPAGVIRLVKGSHIVVPKLYAGDHAYILQARDNRVVFIIPYERDFTLIGTTEVDLAKMPERPEASGAEIQYLCGAATAYLGKPVTPADVVSTFAGVRPLFGRKRTSATKVSRDYHLEVHGGPGAPALSVYGGKLTTYRGLAETAMNKLAAIFPGLGPTWTADTALPGGDLGTHDFDAFLGRMLLAYPWLPAPLCTRYALAYGADMVKIVDAHTSLDGLGRDFGGGLFEAEADYLVKHEWAETAEDILWRRTKIGLHAREDTAAQLTMWLAARGSTKG